MKEWSRMFGDRTTTLSEEFMTNKQLLRATACIIRFMVYLIGSSFLGRLSSYWYPLGYGVVASLTAFSLWRLWPTDLRRSIMPIHFRIGWGVVFGLVGIIFWIILSHLHLERLLTSGLPAWLQVGERVSFNPLMEMNSPLTLSLFLIVRFVGIAALVPLVEELFWRCFLLRWTIDPEWQQIPLGTFTWPSCLTVTALFTLAHPEWFAAASYCLLINGLLYWKKDLWLCVVAHGVSNFALAVYVLITGHWFLW